MFNLQGIVLIAVLCAVDAAVVINVYDDAPEINKLNLQKCDYYQCMSFCQSKGYVGGFCKDPPGICQCVGLSEGLEHRLRECNDNTCDQLCRRMGFISGSCVGTHCECDNFLKQREPERLYSSVEGCDYRECDQRCRRLGFPSGVCVNGRCKCDNFRSRHTDVHTNNDNIVVETVGACNDQGCDFVCRGLGYKRGSCIQGHCVCSNSQNYELALEISSNELKSCVDSECDQNCRRMGFISGKCNGGRCSCRIKTNTEDIREDLIMEIGTEGLKSCVDSECDQNCRRMGFISGKCNNGRCSCRIKTNTEDIREDLTMEIGTEGLKSCVDGECDKNCRRMGFISGQCNEGRCSCRIKTNNKDIHEDLTMEIGTEGLKSCVDSECDQNCRRMGFISGKCNGGRCSCRIKTNTEDIHEDLTMEIGTEGLKSCVDSECDQNCRRMGFISGKCNGGRCSCRIKTNNKDIREDLTMEIGTEGLKSCVDSECDQNCRRMGFISGKCNGGRCSCRIKTNTEDIRENIFEDIDNDIMSGAKSCNDQGCNIVCRALGYKSGSCIQGDCVCTSTQDDETTVVKSLKDLSCNNQDCDRHCRQLGFISGKCVGNRCLCRIIQNLDATTLSDYNEISNNDEDNEISNNDMSSNTIVGCSKNACENSCQGLGHTGGKCFLGRCQCNVQVKSEAAEAIKDCKQVNCTFTCIRMKYIGGYCQSGRCFCF